MAVIGIDLGRTTIAGAVLQDPGKATHLFSKPMNPAVARDQMIAFQKVSPAVSVPGRVKLV